MHRYEIDLGNGRTRIIYSEKPLEEKKSETFGISNITNIAPDGSYLEKPMSEAYIRNIQNRTYTTKERSGSFSPGDYGTGKPIPKEFK